jgi:hypothetical protein
MGFNSAFKGLNKKKRQELEVNSWRIIQAAEKTHVSSWDWIQLTQNTVQWKDLINTVQSLGSTRAGHFLTS